MTIKSNNALSSFMKKQMTEKSVKKGSNDQSFFSGNKQNKDESDKKEEENLTDEEKKEKEELEEAKKNSRMKAAQIDQTEMLKKLIIENIVKFTIIIILMIGFAYGIIEGGPKLFSLLNGAVMKVFLGSLK